MLHYLSYISPESLIIAFRTALLSNFDFLIRLPIYLTAFSMFFLIHILNTFGLRNIHLFSWLLPIFPSIRWKRVPWQTHRSNHHTREQSYHDVFDIYNYEKSFIHKHKHQLFSWKTIIFLDKNVFSWKNIKIIMNVSSCNHKKTIVYILRPTAF